MKKIVALILMVSISCFDVRRSGGDVSPGEDSNW